MFLHLRDNYTIDDTRMRKKGCVTGSREENISYLELQLSMSSWRFTRIRSSLLWDKKSVSIACLQHKTKPQAAKPGKRTPSDFQEEAKLLTSRPSKVDLRSRMVAEVFLRPGITDEFVVWSGLSSACTEVMARRDGETGENMKFDVSLRDKEGRI